MTSGAGPGAGGSGRVTGAGHGAIVRDEVFGPALAVYHAQRATSAIRAGCVRVNDHIPIISEMPHRGTKESGFGKDTSTNSFDEQTVAKPAQRGTLSSGRG